MSRRLLDNPGQKRVFVQTFGCQMNEYDSAKMLEQLRGQDYVAVDSPRQADLILVNTCAIREKSEHKVYSLLGRLGGIKRARPEVVIGVGGCVSQQRGEEILARVKEVDLVFGPDHVFDLPRMLEGVTGGERVVSTEWRHRRQRVANFVPDFGTDVGSAGDVKAGLAITKGCNNFCTFCVVPYTRGREVSREPENILAEARAQVAGGVKELTLLGQNVNSYRAGGVHFVELLRRLDEIEGLERIRYTSPHPKDFREELAQAHAELPKLCEHVHLPFQSGSDRILRAMRRNHEIAGYLDKMSMIRRHVPDVALSTDVIVGFPGEEEADFEATLDVMRTVRFDHVYAFKYSPRSGTPAAELPDQVPESVRAERLERLFALHDEIVQERNAALIGTRQEVLVEGAHPRGGGAMTGRTRGNKPVMLMESAGVPGDLVPVDIVAARKYSLVARDASRDL
ncbi:MAG TPA: tRNA (N6-isopentenyl adenosine(37)-C2)-methylthiotransferase MiaB [bacterium]|nr:tRNA (N6-isopentenyl adenosine(37)-C2)-methylthiotransferase MiaB [bacterium]